MTFGEKLCKLRKEKKLSQEALAEKLNTTRQAISKWENNQGLPEAEKILTLSNIFGVSIDYLLKTGDENPEINTEGYYVSKEKAEAWLNYERNSTKKIGIGIVCLLLIRIPFIIISENSPILWVICMALATIGIGIIIAHCLNDKYYEYKVLKKNVLIFDNHYLTDLTERYTILKKKYVWMIFISFFTILFGATPIFFFENSNYFNIYKIIYTFLAIFAIYILIFSFSMISAYELLVENQNYTNGMYYKLLKKWKI